jgi:hypothetical protein
METTALKTEIAVESVRDDGRLVAEGVMSNDEKIVAFREEVTRMLAEMRDMLRLSHQDLRNRVGRLERAREREGRDPVELIREKFGKRPEQV